MLSIFRKLCFTAIGINIGLAVFNCLPLYPLDGFHITLQLLPAQSRERFAGMAPYGTFLIIGLVVANNALGVPILTSLILPPVRFLLYNVAGINQMSEV